MKRKIAAAIAGALLGGCATTPHGAVLDKYPAGVVGHTSVAYYEVHGRTIAELRADMRKSGPRIADTGFVAETRTPIRTSYNTEAHGGSCSISKIEVFVNAQVLLPHWTPPADTQPGVAAEWNRFVAALETHEAGHKDISAKAGKEIVDKLGNLSGSCSFIGTRASDISREIRDRERDAQARYDAETHHGGTQGTSLGGPAPLDPRAPLQLASRPTTGTTAFSSGLPFDSLWAALRPTFEDIGLKVNIVDSAGRAMGDSLTVRTALADLPASQVNCGTAITGAPGDSIPISLMVSARIDLITGVDGTPGRFVTATVQAIARPKSAAPVVCRSRGVIEQQFMRAFRKRIGP